ncbi:hypothetical protein BDL97_19G085500 [Sphagnum fallax]|nr:hypothetical protein BDL97_19G085500 [Sphagnum fallax]
MGETSGHKEAFLTEVLGFLKAQNLEEIDEERKLFLASNKVQALVDILMHHRDVKDMRCIVFVERKIATKVLADFLSSIAMFASSLQFQPLAGKTEGMDAMTRKLQQEAVQSFRAGHVNVLVSTNVAEEGLDIQSCCLVIRFDLPKTPSSLIQSRGRARREGSTYVYLVERGNNDQFERLQQLKWKESLMKEQALSRIERMESVGSPQTQGLEMFQVETTGASISTQYCISLLHQYCGRLPRDSFYTPAPKFTYTMESSDIRCSIVLPPESLVKTVKGWACSTRIGAKQSACFEACKQLYEAGALSDLFLINSDDLENDDMDFLAADDDDTPSGKAQQELHPLFVPDVFRGSWSQASSCVTLYGYTIKFVPKPSDRSYANFRLFVESDLGEEVVNSPLQLELQGQRVVEAQCSSAGKLEFKPDQIQDAKIFQERALSALLDQNPGSREAGEWSPSRLYLLLPLQSHDLDDNPHPPVDWECVKKLISDPMFVEDQDCLNEPTSLQTDWSSSSFSLHTCTVQLANGRFPVEAILDSVVETTHSREAGPSLFCGCELILDLNANSPMRNQGIKKNFSCYAQYFSEKHSVQLVHRNQPMLNATRLIGVQNLLTPRTIGSQGAPECKDKAMLELPLELCYIKMQGFSCKLVNGVSLLPSFMHRLEARLLAAQLRHMLSQSYPAATRLSIDRMLEAITTANCQESFSLEGLEHLGDSFLKFAVSERLFLIHDQIDEGHLTKRRKAIICNPMLQKLGTEHGLTGYIQDAQFSPSDWLAPGRPLDLQKTKDAKTRLLAPKRIADVVEALIGAHYIEGGVDAALSFMKWLGLEVGVNLNLREQARMCSDWDRTLLENIDVIQLEMLLDYRFNNKGLLVQALTHASCERSCGACYQRLEFLGDAVLDFSITKHYFETSAQEKRDPGKLTDLRSAAVNNEHFAQVAVRHKLYKYLLHNSLPLKRIIDKYVEHLRSAVTDDKSCYGWEGDNNPGTLGDIVESLAGAVLLDSGFNCDTVWRVFKKLLAPLATAETVPIEPTRELRELCDEYKFENRKPTKIKDDNNNVLSTVTVVVNGKEISETAWGTNGNSATKHACVQLLKTLKACGYQHKRWRTPGSYSNKVPKQSSEQCRVVRASLNDCNKTTEEAVCIHGSEAAQDLEIDNISESTKEAVCIQGLSEAAPDSEIDNILESTEEAVCVHGSKAKISEVSDMPEPPQRGWGATCGNGLTGNSELGKLCAFLLQDSKSKIPYLHSSSNVATTSSPHFDGAGVDRKFCRDTRHSSCEQQHYTQSAFTESLQTPIYVQESSKMFSQLHPPQTCKEGQRLKNSSNSSSHNAGFMGGQFQDVGIDGSLHWFSPNPGQETNSAVGWHSIDSFPR